MRHASSLALIALVCLSLAGPAAPARADVPIVQSWFPVPALPYGVLAHSDGTVWVGTSGNVLRYSRTGTLLGTVAAHAAASLAEAPGGDVYALDYWGRVVNRYTSAGTFVQSWPMNYAAREGGRVVVDAAGNVYVLCFTSGFVTSALVKYSATGTELAAVTGLTGSDGLALSGGVLYCSEIYGGVMQRFSLALAPLGTIVNPAVYGTGLGSDAAGNLMQPDYYGHTVHYLDAAGNALGQFVTTGAGYFPQWTPQGVDESTDHVYFVADTYNWQVVLFNGSVVATETASWGGLKASFR